MTEKELVLKAMEDLPEKPEKEAIEIAMERLLLLSKIEEGKRDVENGDIYTIEEVEAMVDGWLK